MQIQRRNGTRRSERTCLRLQSMISVKELGYDFTHTCMRGRSYFASRDLRVVINGGRRRQIRTASGSQDLGGTLSWGVRYPRVQSDANFLHGARSPPRTTDKIRSAGRNAPGTDSLKLECRQAFLRHCALSLRTPG